MQPELKLHYFPHQVVFAKHIAQLIRDGKRDIVIVLHNAAGCGYTNALCLVPLLAFKSINVNVPPSMAEQMRMLADKEFGRGQALRYLTVNVAKSRRVNITTSGIPLASP